MSGNWRLTFTFEGDNGACFRYVAGNVAGPTAGCRSLGYASRAAKGISTHQESRYVESGGVRQETHNDPLQPEGDELQEQSAIIRRPLTIAASSKH